MPTKNAPSDGRYWRYCLLGFIMLLSLTGCYEGSNGVTTLRIAHPLEVTHPNNLALEYLAQDLQDRSGGTMTVELYPGGQLGNDRECLELLQVGSLDMAVTSAVILEGFAPPFKIFGLPYLFENKKQRLDALNGEFGHQLLESGIPYRLRGLAYFDAGSRSFYTKDAVVKTPDDLIGKKIRVLGSPMAIRTVRALGASPTPISWGELYTALQQGVVDAAENNPPSLVSSRHYEITPYFSLDEHSAIPDILTMGEASWKRLNEQQKIWVKASVRAAAKYQYQLWTQAEIKAIQTLKTAGVTLYSPEKGPFMQAVTPLYEEFKQDEPELYKLVEKIRPQ
ncbi:TRAP transporter substrate-binding protein [Coraliomargarita sp. W4R53]